MEGGLTPKRYPLGSILLVGLVFLVGIVLAGIAPSRGCLGEQVASHGVGGSTKQEKLTVGTTVFPTRHSMKVPPFLKELIWQILTTFVKYLSTIFLMLVHKNCQKNSFLGFLWLKKTSLAPFIFLR